MNTLISIGWLGNKSCYLNISLDEAKKRYLLINPEEDDLLERENGFVSSFVFNDQFSAYEVSEDPDRDAIVNTLQHTIHPPDGTDSAGNKYELSSEGEDDV